MRLPTSVPALFLLTLLLGLTISCKKDSGPSGESHDTNPATGAVKDPVQEEIYAYRMKVRPFYNSRKFDNLESLATEARAGKQLFGNGSWRIAEFYESLACRDEETEGMWQLHDQIHQAWIKAKPDSLTARVAYADFLGAMRGRRAATVTP